MTNFTTVKKNLEAKRLPRQYVRHGGRRPRTIWIAPLTAYPWASAAPSRLEQMGLYEQLSGHNRVFWHWRPESAEDPRREAMTADMYITSVNGMAETGELINIDGNGNRVASSLYGHKKVWFIVGRNKLAPHLRGGPLAGAEHCRTEECPAAGPENALRRSWQIAAMTARARSGSAGAWWSCGRP